MVPLVGSQIYLVFKSYFMHSCNLAMEIKNIHHVPNVELF